VDAEAREYPQTEEVEYEVEQAGEECDDAEGCLKFDCCAHSDVQQHEHVEECLEVFQACTSI
jgi:hypothetical protein